MSIDSFIFKLAILIIPGFFGLHVIKTFSGIPLSEKRSLSTYDFFLILLLSLVSALFLDLVTRLFNKGQCNFSMLDWIINFDGKNQIPITALNFLELLGINLVLGLFTVYINRCQLLYRFLAYIHVSNAFGREDMWSHFTSSIDKEKWVIVRDITKNYMYVGAVYMTSETFEKRELILRFVQVYSLNNEGKHLFDADYIYLPLGENEFTIEIQPEESE